MQTLLSSQAFGLAVWAQPVLGSQLSVVQSLLSLQSVGTAPGWQVPPEQMSPVVHAFPSLQAAVLFV